MCVCRGSFCAVCHIACQHAVLVFKLFLFSWSSCPNEPFPHDSAFLIFLLVWCWLWTSRLPEILCVSVCALRSTHLLLGSRTVTKTQWGYTESNGRATGVENNEAANILQTTLDQSPSLIPVFLFTRLCKMLAFAIRFFRACPRATYCRSWQSDEWQLLTKWGQDGSTALSQKVE